MEGLPGHPVRRCRPGARGGTDLLSGRRLVLVRHGRTAHNAGGRFQGQLDIGLDDAGRAQADVLARSMTGYDVTAVLSSDLARARDTAAPLGAALGLPVRLDPRLRELDLGGWQGLTFREAAEQFPQEYAAWRAGRDVPRGGGESHAQAGERGVQVVREAPLPDGGTLVLVTHGGTARAMLSALLELPHEVAWRLGALGNACRSVLVEADRGWRLERHNVEPALVPVAAAAPVPVRTAGPDRRTG